MEERTKIILITMLCVIAFIAFIDFLLSTWKEEGFRKQATIGDRVKYWKDGRVYYGKIKSIHGEWFVVGEVNDDEGCSVHMDSIFKP